MTVKRETGVIPVRSRHCDRGVEYKKVTDAQHWEGNIHMMILQPGNLPIIMVQEAIPDHE